MYVILCDCAFHEDRSYKGWQGMACSLQLSRGRDIIQTKCRGTSLFVRKSQLSLIRILFKMPNTFGEVCHVGIPAGITVLTVSKAMDAVAKCCSSFQARLSSVALTSNSCTLATACTRGNPKLWSQLSWLVPSPPPFQTEEHQRVQRAGFTQEGRRQRGRQGSRGGTVCRD